MGGDAFDVRLVALVEEMIAAWREAPNPPPIMLPNDTRSSLSDAGATAVMWGWTARVIRTAEAALSLHRDGFDTEAAPLMRSIVEHAIALAWVADKRGAAFQTLARERAEGWSRFQDAQKNGWALDGEAAAQLERATVVETDKDTIKEDVHRRTAHRAQTYKLGSLYQAWLYETWLSHPTLISAEPYFHLDAGSGKGRLYRAVAVAADDLKLSGGVAIAVHTSLAHYETLHEDAFPGRLQVWAGTFEQIMSDRRAASSVDDTTGLRPAASQTHRGTQAPAAAKTAVIQRNR